MRATFAIALLLAPLFMATSVPLRAESRADIAAAVKQLSPQVLADDEQNDARRMVIEQQKLRRNVANDRSTAEWRKIKNRAQWEAFRKQKLAALRESLGDFPKPPEDLHVHVSKTFAGEGYQRENIAFESRPGLWVTANLYRPQPPRKLMPGLVIASSHHNPKTQGELQDMGVLWARAGCLVVVPDHLGHGERRQHTFASAKDYDGEFRVSRQDYYFRYDTGMQLHLVGDSLMGWMVWDLSRCVDLLLKQEGIDPQRIIMLGSVAGGGDPCAVVSALDERIDGAVPFNFGGPQPETRFPLPEDAEAAFNYAGGGSWESTRNLRLSCRDGFLPWVIVGAVCPRPLVYAHEFAWDREHDPVWGRYEKLYAMYDVPDYRLTDKDPRLSSTHGRGSVKGRPPEATHCNNIGLEHRKGIHPAFEHCFGIKATESSDRRDSSELLCMTDELARKLKPQRLIDLLPPLADQRAQEIRNSLKQSGKDPQAARRLLQARWKSVLLSEEPPQWKAEERKHVEFAGGNCEQVVLTTEPGIRVPLLLLLPADHDGKRLPVVVAAAQSGKAKFLDERSDTIGELLASGVAVCLPDVRNTGESCEEQDRGQYSAATARSSLELMLGGTSVGQKLKDLQQVIRYLRSREQIDPNRVAVWGDSFAEANSSKTNFRVPRRVDGRPKQSEPLGGLLALLAALNDPQLRAVYVHGGLTSFRSVLEDQTVLLPHDCVLPGVSRCGDLTDLAAGLAPQALRLDGLVDGLNRRVSAENAKELYRQAAESHRRAGNSLAFGDGPGSAAAWLKEQLK